MRKIWQELAGGRNHKSLHKNKKMSRNECINEDVQGWSPKFNSAWLLQTNFEMILIFGAVADFQGCSAVAQKHVLPHVKVQQEAGDQNAIAYSAWPKYGPNLNADLRKQRTKRYVTMNRIHATKAETFFITCSCLSLDAAVFRQPFSLQT